ncbi:MAG: HmuY family protein [Cytophagales bacterium]|nr:HmuY family protein [Cytophagales bacterium]
MTKYLLKLFAIAWALIVIAGCEESEEPLPQLLAGFTSTSLGLALADDEKSVDIELSRTDQNPTTVRLNVADAAGTEYGTDYETVPAASGGKINVEIPANGTSAALIIKKLRNPEFGEVKSFSLTISSVSNEGSAGNNSKLEVTFEENPTSSGAILMPEVGGPEQPNQVFIDLSKQSATVVSKDIWDLAFSGGNEFRVMLNYATYAMARATDKTELADVTETLVTEEFKNEMVVGQVNTAYMDDPSGDLSKTVIAEISATASENKVYVLNRGQLDTDPSTERGFVKLKIARNGDAYDITYGDINATAGFTTVTVSKNADTNFSYFSISENKVVDVAPMDSNWDFVLTTFTNTYFDGTDLYSYKFKDFVLTNYGHMKIAKVDVTAEVTYDGFTRDDVPGVSLEDHRTGIGSSWRLFDFPTFTYTINTKIFYIVEDTDGNHYKLKFTKMLNDQGERGYPEFVYELL